MRLMGEIVLLFSWKQKRRLKFLKILLLRLKNVTQQRKHLSVVVSSILMKKVADFCHSINNLLAMDVVLLIQSRATIYYEIFACMYIVYHVQYLDLCLCTRTNFVLYVYHWRIKFCIYVTWATYILPIFIVPYLLKKCLGVYFLKCHLDFEKFF